MVAYIYRGPRREQPDDTIPADQRIVDAAIDLYGDKGFTGVSLRTIAARAGVSAPLIIHHFGSKDGLRRACDRYAAEIVNQFKTEAVSLGENFTVQMMLGRIEESQPILRYIIQSLVIGGPEINTIMDDFVDHAVTNTAEAVQKGLIKPATDERRRAALLLMQGLGSIMLHRQMKRYLGVSLLDDPPSQFGSYISTAMEIYTQGVIEPGAFGDLTPEF